MIPLVVKKSICSLLILLSFSTVGQSFCDDFESYALGRLDSQSVIWDAWPSSIGVQDTEASDLHSFSAGQSMRVHAKGPNAWSDIFTDFGAIDSGSWSISYKVLVPSNGGGRLASLAFYNSNSPSSSIFMHLINLNGNTTKGKIYDVNGTNLSLVKQFDFVLNQWFEISMEVDLDLKKVEYYIDSVLLHSGDWRSGDGILQNQLQAFNIWSQNEAVGFQADLFVDDFCLSGGGQMSMEQALGSRLKLFPNPSGRFLNVQGLPYEGTTHEIHDIRGRLIRQGYHLAGRETLHVDLEDLPSGTYLFRSAGSTSIFIKK